MTLLFTESFGAFKRHTGTNAELSTVANYSDMLAAMARAGMNLTQSTSYLGMLAVPDPVNPERSALAIVPKTGTPSQYTKLLWPMALQGAPFIFGFSLFLPSDWPDLPTDTAVMIDGITGPASQMAGSASVPNAFGRMFSIGHDRRVRLSTAAATTQSQRQATIGGMTYFEVRYTKGSVRVWMDDALVYEAAAELWEGGVGLAVAISSSLSPIYAAGSAIRPCIGNVYCLTEDAHAPNVRLGPTTRVIPRKPAGDVDVEFLLPTGFTSNAQVVEQDILGALPVNTLQSETVGARDEYALALNGAIANSPKVHAVVTKVVASNLESTPHEIRPWVKSGESETVDEFAFEAVLRTLPLAVGFTSAAMREDGTLFACGVGPSVVYSTDGGETWLVGYNGAGTVTANDIAVGPDGTVIACCSSGGLLLQCNGTDGPEVWSTVTAPLSNALSGIAVSPSGTWIIETNATAQRLIKEGAGNWRTQARTASAGQAAIWVEDRFITTHINAIQHSVTGADGTWSANTLTLPTSDAPAGVIKVGGRYLMGPRGFSSTPYLMTIIAAESLPSSGALTVQTESHEIFYSALTIGSTTLRGFAKADDGLVLLAPDRRSLLWTRDGRTLNVHVDPVVYTLGGFGKPAAVRGGFIIPDRSTGSGKLVQLRKRKASRPLLNIDGYTQHTNIASLDPATGLPWTSSAAAAVTVGMTLDK